MASIDGNDPVGGIGRVVEIDESYIGCASKDKGLYRANKTLVMGILERDGVVMTKVVPNNRKVTLLPEVAASEVVGSIVHTDELMTYRSLTGMGCEHHTTCPSMRQYVGPTGGHVNTIEGFWAQLKRGINGTHIHVSAKHLPKYLSESEYRHNMRKVRHLMLDRLMHSFAR